MSSARRLVTPGSSRARDRSPPRSQAPPVRSPSSGARRGMVPGRNGRGGARCRRRATGQALSRELLAFTSVSCCACGHHGRGHPASLRRAHLPSATHTGSRAARHARADFVLDALTHQPSRRVRCPIVRGPPAPGKAGLHEGGSCQATSTTPLDSAATQHGVGHGFIERGACAKCGFHARLVQEPDHNEPTLIRRAAARRTGPSPTPRAACGTPPCRARRPRSRDRRSCRRGAACRGRRPRGSRSRCGSRSRPCCRPT